MKKLLFAFLLLPCTLFAQHLEEKDIDVFLNGWAVLGTVVEENEYSPEFTEYMTLLENVDHALFSFYEESITFEEMAATYDSFLSCEAPDFLQKTFNDIGWETDGQKKFCTLSFGLAYFISIKAPMEEMLAGLTEEEKEAVENMLAKGEQIFDPRDLDLIEENLEEIITFLQSQ